MTADFLAWLRETYGLTQKDLAQNAGISKSYIEKLEYGTKPINESVEQRIVSALKLDAERLTKFKRLYSEVQSVTNPRR